MTDEPPVPVPMTREERDALDAATRDGSRVSAWHVLHALVARFDAAVARPAEPERTVRWCEAHGHALPCHERYDRNRCRVTTREVGRVVGGEA